jgi:hypothetical protein
MNAQDLFIYTFLFIFIALAVLTVGSLPGWIKIPEHYRRKLFATLVLQVIGCVVLFAKQTFDARSRIDAIQTRHDYLVFLTKNEWSWHYSPLNWITTGHFTADGDKKVRFDAETYVKCERAGHDANVKIYSWSSAQPIPIPAPGEDVIIPCKQTIFPAVSDVVGPTQRVAGTYNLTLRLHLGKALVGTYEIIDQTQGSITGGMAFSAER